MDYQKKITQLSYPFLASLGVLSILSIAISLLPLAQWARTQNECVERTFRTEDSNAGIPAKVWSCNGGGD